MNEKLMVFVLMIAYNYKKYIVKAIESGLTSKVSFLFQSVITDNYSKAKTAQVILNCSQKYSKIFNVLARGMNVGVSFNAIEKYLRCPGKILLYSKVATIGQIITNLKNSWKHSKV